MTNQKENRLLRSLIDWIEDRIFAIASQNELLGSDFDLSCWNDCRPHPLPDKSQVIMEDSIIKPGNHMSYLVLH
jgi:hypothetical protein